MATPKAIPTPPTAAKTVFAIGDHVTLSPNYREIYSNAFRTASTNWDVQLTFTRGRTDANNKVSMEEQITIFVTPAQAKLISLQMAGVVTQYEPCYR